MGLTVGEVSRVFEKLPPQLQVVVCVDDKLTVSDATGDRISGHYSGLWGVGGIDEGEVFTVGQGYLPVIIFKTREEY